MVNNLSHSTSDYDGCSDGCSLSWMSKIQSWVLTFCETTVSWLIWDATDSQTQGIASHVLSPSPTLLPRRPLTEFESILSEFPTVMQPCGSKQPPKHDSTHHIKTTGPPVSARTRRLALECLKIARQEFEHMLQLGIVRPSSSSWSSPLHMVPKKTLGDWCPCRDYRALNNATVLKNDIHCSAAELVYGTALRLPSDFFDSTKSNDTVDRTMLDSSKQQCNNCKLSQSATNLSEKCMSVMICPSAHTTLCDMTQFANHWSNHMMVPIKWLTCKQTVHCACQRQTQCHLPWPPQACAFGSTSGYSLQTITDHTHHTCQTSFHRHKYTSHTFRTPCPLA